MRFLRGHAPPHDTRPAHLVSIFQLPDLPQGGRRRNHIKIEGGLTMTYRVYSGPRGSQSISPLDKDRYLFKEFSLLDEAMNWARHINDGGRVTLLIEGDDGTRLTKQQIVTALRSPDAGEAA
jgi:hypothetical protein